ncbi:MAG: Ig-like domain-containing protein [bacterium]
MNRGRELDMCTIAGVALLCAQLSCGGTSGDGGITAEPPSVTTTVQISAPASSVVVGDSLRLTATVLDQRGAAMPGKSVSWSSGAPTIATVTSSGVVTGIAAGTAAISAGVDGKSAATQITVTVPARISFDQTKVVTAAIGSLGGTLTTSSGGSTFTLIVPAGSLASSVQISMTPVTAMRQLPAEGEFIAAVKLEPAGTKFRKAATLRVVQKVTAVSGKRSVGYLANDTGAVVALEPMTQVGDTLSIRVPHFSVAGGGQFNPIPLAPLVFTFPASLAADAFINQIAALPLHATIAQYVPILRAWYTTSIEPQLLAGSSSSPDVSAQAAADFDTWTGLIANADAFEGFSGALIAALATEQQRGDVLLPGVLKQGISGFNARCAAVVTFDPTEAENVFMLQDIAANHKVATVANGLDTPTVLKNICPQLVNSTASFPANPSAGTAATLDLQYGLKFGVSPQLQGAPLQVGLTLSGTTTDGIFILLSNAQGHVSQPVTPTGQVDFVADAEACIDAGVGYRLTEICTKNNVTRQFGLTINGDVLVTDQNGFKSLANVAKVTGNLTIQGPGVTSTDLLELLALREVGKTLSIESVPGLFTLQGLGKVTKVGTLSLLDLPIASLQVIGGMDYQGLSVEKLPNLATLASLRTPSATLAGSLRLVNNATLTNIAVLRSVKQVGGDFAFSTMPTVTTYADFAALEQVGRDATFGGAAITSVAGLANVRTIGRDLNVLLNDLDRITAFTLPSLTSVRGWIVGSQVRTVPGNPPGSIVSVQLPALTDLGAGAKGATGATKRFYDLSIPAMRVAHTDTSFDFSNLVGLGSLTFATTFKDDSGGLHIEDNPDMTTLTIGKVDVGKSLRIRRNAHLLAVKLDTVKVGNPQLPLALRDIEIGNDASLTKIQFGGGSLLGKLLIRFNPALLVLGGRLASASEISIHDNPSLSNQAALAFAATIHVSGLVNVVNNGSP